MSTAELLLIAFGLAMDAFAVSLAASVMLGRVTPRQVFRFSWHFGLFQALMPIVGWTAGLTVERWIKAWDHWVAFGLLVLIGGRALYTAIRGDDDLSSGRDPTRGWMMVGLSVAVSIDALAVGVSLAALDVNVWWAVLWIGVVAGTMTLVGMLTGARLGKRFGRAAAVAGGLVLIGIGVKILLEHLAGE